MTDLQNYLQMIVPVLEGDLEEGKTPPDGTIISARELATKSDILLTRPVSEWPEGLAFQLAKGIAVMRVYYDPKFGSSFGLGART